jgi:phosphotriesterase-related protein
MSMLADLRRRPMSTTRDNMALDDVDLAIRELQYFTQSGGKTLVDVTCYGLGRDPIALQRISRATGLNIVMATGFYVENAHPPWVKDMSADQLADLMVSEIATGVGDTGVRCGIIGEIGLTGIPKGAGRKKVGPVTPEEEKALRGAARAALQTGLSVTVHLDPIPPRASITAVDILEEEGVPPERIILDHMDQVNDVDYHLEAASRGVFIEYDSLGRDHYTDEWGYGFDWGHDSWRVRFAKQLIDSGHREQLLFSQDVCFKTDLRAYGGVGYSHVLTTICPTLRALGVSQEAIDQILVANPMRALTNAAAAAPRRSELVGAGAAAPS